MHNHPTPAAPSAPAQLPLSRVGGLEDRRPSGEAPRIPNGPALRAQRDALGLSIAQVADHLGLAGATVRSWEAGRRPIPPQHREGLVQLGYVAASAAPSNGADPVHAAERRRAVDARPPMPASRVVVEELAASPHVAPSAAALPEAPRQTPSHLVAQRLVLRAAQLVVRARNLDAAGPDLEDALDELAFLVRAAERL